jgi:hypothetical protein
MENLDLICPEFLASINMIGQSKVLITRQRWKEHQIHTDTYHHIDRDPSSLGSAKLVGHVLFFISLVIFSLVQPLSNIFLAFL